MSGQDFTQWDNEYDNISSDKQKLLAQMTELAAKGESADVLYRIAKVNVYLAKQSEKAGNKEQEKAYALKAQTYADKACKLEPNNPECHKWMCAAVGILANLSASKEKIKYGFEFQKHAEIALKIKPNDPMLQSMYGQWCFNVASLSWLEQKLATTIYGAIPKADYAMALTAFKKVHELTPDSKDNHLWMAKTLIAMKNYKEAPQWIHRGLTLQNKNISDEIAHNELQALAKKYPK